MLVSLDLTSPLVAALDKALGKSVPWPFDRPSVKRHELSSEDRKKLDDYYAARNNTKHSSRSSLAAELFTTTRFLTILDK